MSYPNYCISIIERIKQNSVMRANGCLEYAGGKLKNKYGLVSITLNGKRKSLPAHRAMFMAVHDQLELSSRIHIRHTCGGKACCVNADHLIAGTPKDSPRRPLLGVSLCDLL